MARVSDQLPPRQFEQIFRGWICVTHDEVLAEQQHGGREQLEPGILPGSFVGLEGRRWAEHAVAEQGSDDSSKFCARVRALFAIALWPALSSALRRSSRAARRLVSALRDAPNISAVFPSLPAWVVERRCRKRPLLRREASLQRSARRSEPCAERRPALSGYRHRPWESPPGCCFVVRLDREPRALPAR